MSGSSEPSSRRMRFEPNPDIPLDFTSIPSVKIMIAENNSQTKPKRRLKPADFIDEAFRKLGERAVDERITVLSLLDFLKECAAKHGSLPRSSAIAKVLYQWSEKGLVEEGRQVLEVFLEMDTSLCTKVLDEKLATLALRLLTRFKKVDTEHINKIMALLPENCYKRRLFSPLLEHAARTADTTLAFDTLRLARGKGIEFWDADYNHLLLCLKNANCTTSTHNHVIEELLECMADHHPVVGKKNGEALLGLIGGKITSVDETTGICKTCKGKLHTFELEANERSTLLHDIETKLVAPRVDGLSHYEKECVVSQEEKEKRWKEFEAFKSKISNLQYDAVIDGANVGYYGLTNWYKGAKEALLRSRGVDPHTVPEFELTNVPFPVDVPPKFSLIDDMLKQTRGLGKSPLIMLHSRHVDFPSIENTAWLSKWQSEASVIACPKFLNDDYCWLFAAIYKPNCFVISNDQMRDHHFMLLSHRSFLRWRQRHRVTYKALFERATGAVTLVVTRPRPYSVWVQRGRLSRLHWHIPMLTQVDIIDQGTNRAYGKEREIDKDGDDTCDAWLCNAPENSFSID